MKKFIHESVLEDIELESINVDGKRFYLTPDGEKYPSITTVLSSYNKKSIYEWRKRVGDKEANKISTKASRRGTKVHKLCENYLNNLNINLNDFTPDNIEMFNTIKPILNEIDIVYAQEKTLFSHHLKTAGRVDCIARFMGKKTVIDFKTSSKPKRKDWIENYFMQGAGYSVMWEEMTKIPISNIAIIIAVDGEEPQLFMEKRDNWIEKFIELRENYDH